MDRQRFDVIVVGAGIAGSGLAAALAESTLRVALVEAQPLKTGWPSPGEGVADFDPRVSALTVASQRFLEQLGAWTAIAERRISPYQHMHVWDGEGTAFIDFDADDINEHCLGHIVENRLTVAALLEQVRKASNITLIDGVKLAALMEEEGRRVIALENGQQLTAPLLVAADGAFSFLRKEAGFQMREWAYGHSAIVTTVQMEKPHEATAWQRFMPEGPLAFLPLRTQGQEKEKGKAQHICSIVWSAQTQYADNLMALDDKAFSSSLERALESRLGKVLALGPRFSFPLCQRHATDYTQPGLVLVADAAHTIHPLAGQGINIGLKDIAVLAEEILRAQQRGLNPGHPSVLSRYQRRRKGDNLAMMMTMEGFKRLFAETALPVRWARNAGMRWVNQITPLKNQLVRQAMGL